MSTVPFTQTLAAAAVSNQFELQPGQSVTYLADTADLDEATLVLEQSRNGYVWEGARDHEGVLVDNVVGSAGAESSTAILRNEGVNSLRFRAVLLETGTLAGTIVITFTTRADPAKLEDVVLLTDEGVEFLVPVTLPDAGALTVEDGAGLSGADGYGTSVEKVGGLIITRIYVDIDGLFGGGAANDIIGNNGAGAAYIGQVTAARNGNIVAGTKTCLEVPTGSDPDVDLWSANEATGVEDTLITDLTGEVQLTNGGDHTLARTLALIALPVAGQYLYLTGGDTTAAEYTAGKFLITLIGTPA